MATSVSNTTNRAAVGGTAAQGSSGGSTSKTTAAAGGSTASATTNPVGNLYEGWPSYDDAVANDRSTPVLIILTDFSDSDIGDYLPSPDQAWAKLMFGRNQGQGNHYWYEITRGQFQMLPANESYGTANDGVVHVHLTSAKPTSGTFVVEEQPWIPEALDLAAEHVDFAKFDRDGDGHLSNGELSVMLPLNLDFAQINGAGAQANIALNHQIQGTNVVLDMFSRVEDDYTSIGTPLHELGHHIFDLDHFASPTDHCLMGLGAYAEDPVITRLHLPNSHYATRPTGLMAWHQIQMGLVTPTRITETTRGVELYSSHHLQFNVIELPVKDGFVYLENRTRVGYDQSIPFCNGDTGALFVTEISQYLQPLNLPGLTARFAKTTFDEPDDSVCDTYALAGTNDTFSIGQFTISNVSNAGSVMTLDITKRDLAPSIDHYKVRYWVINPDNEGYRMFHNVPVQQNGTLEVDFATFPFGDDPSAWFTISLEAYYTTGEVRSVNAEATWTSSHEYLFPDILLINQMMPKSDAIVHLLLNPSATSKVTSADLQVSHADFTTTIRFINMP